MVSFLPLSPPFSMPPKDSKEQRKSGNVKVTYLNRTKRNSREPSVDDLARPLKPPRAASRKTPSPAKPNPVFKAPDDPIPIVDFRTETSPKRVNTEKDMETSDRSSATTKKKAIRQNRTSSSTIPTAEELDGGTKTISSGPSRAKPASVASRLSQSNHRSQTPVSESNCDNTSVADSLAESNSISSGRIKRTEAERKQYFENESECGSVEAHRALCTRCKKWVRLSPKQMYSVRPWEMHRARCDQKLPVEPTYKHLGLVAALPFVVPRTEKVRKALLELDDTASAVEPEQIKCKTCQQWVPLEKKYRLKCWTTHKSACHNNLIPVDIEKTLERKLFFLCDAQFKRFQNPHTVECATCNKGIPLNPDIDYDLEKWLVHKESCHIQLETRRDSRPSNAPSPSSPKRGTQSQVNTIPPSVPAGTTTSDLTIPESQTQPATPGSGTEPNRTSTMSTADSERTLVPVSSSGASLPPSNFPTLAVPPRSSPLATTPVSASGSLKRKRESFGDIDPYGAKAELLKQVDGERPTRRPRTDSYIPEDKEAPSGLGWFLLPFKAFAKGFKESLTTLDDS